jgi:hypothetical protein
LKKNERIDPMKAVSRILLITLLVVSFAGCTSSIKRPEKQIVVVVEKCPNYIFHLMAVAKVGFDSEYGDKYKDSVLPEDIAYIQRHKNLLLVGGGSAGELVDVMISFPSYINLESADAFKEYFSLLDMGFNTNNFQPFLEKYDLYNEKLKHWFPVEEEYLRSITEYREVIAELGRIYLRNYATYEEKVWDAEKTELDKVALKINQYFKDRDIISKWEAVTGKEFKFNNYQIVLCSAIKNGPDANSLGYERIVFYPDTAFDYMTQFISHETGTHILIDVLKEVYGLKKFEDGMLYGAYESLAKFYNAILLNNKNLSYNMPQFHDEEYLKIYDEIYHKNQNIPATELLVEGIETFQKLQSKAEAK